jgi:SAM-dependent methyltransferase
MPGPNSIRLFDELAEGYDQLAPMFGTFGESLVALMGPGPGTDFLDIGSGRGAVAIAALGRGATVVAVDASPRMAHALERDHPDVETRVMDAHRLAFAGGVFDMAAASFVIHVVEDPSRVLSEARRVLRPGGLLALTTPDPSTTAGRTTSPSSPASARVLVRPRPPNPSTLKHPSSEPALKNVRRRPSRSTCPSPRPRPYGTSRCHTASLDMSARLPHLTNRNSSGKPSACLSACSRRGASGCAGSRTSTPGTPPCRTRQAGSRAMRVQCVDGVTEVDRSTTERNRGY